MAIATTGEAAKLHPAMALIPRAPRSYPSSSHGLPSSRRPAGLLASSSSSSSRYVAGMCSSSSFVDPQEARDLRLRRMVEAFDPNVPLPQAVTPPSSWYTDPSFLDLELDRVFLRGWQAVGYTEQLQNPRDYFTGRLGTVNFVVCQDADGDRHAFHNVCRHHASLLAYGSGQKSCFVCPYHDADAFMQRSLEESEKVQMEDVELCEGVQKGLESPAYCSGRYAPNVEQAMHHFHCRLYESLK